MNDLTHASFFSGVGGLDLGLERAGWRTVSFSEIDPYASAVLAERWSGVPNLGDIVQLAGELPPARPGLHRDGPEPRRQDGPQRGADGWDTATLWTGGFPCQDLSVAGKRRGMGTAEDRTRSGLAYAFLDLVEQHRPPAILLENVPGLLSSHRGRDMAALLGRLAELGYGVGYRILDARHFGVPQRRRRVFIVGLRPGGRAGAERAAEVLSVGSRCQRHPAAGVEAGPGVTGGAASGVDIVGTLDGSFGHHGGANTLQSGYQGHYVANGLRASDGHHGWSSPRGDGADNLISASPDPGGVRETDGLAGGVDDLAPTLTAPDTRRRVEGGKRQDGSRRDRIPIIYTKSRRAQTTDDDETWVGGEVMPTLNSFDVGDVRTTAAIIGQGPQDDSLLPLGLDSHRYRCCGNGVVSDVSEWIGRQLMAAIGERVA